MDQNTVCTNRKAKFDYFIEEELVAGMCLLGWEVKALRNGRANIQHAYVRVEVGGVVLIGADIAPMANVSKFDKPSAKRDRLLLLNKKEIKKLLGFVTKKENTAVALEVFWLNGRAKVRIGLCSGKRKHDKRNAIKERQIDREMKSGY